MPKKILVFMFFEIIVNESYPPAAVMTAAVVISVKIKNKLYQYPACWPGSMADVWFFPPQEAAKMRTRCVCGNFCRRQKLRAYT